MYDNFYFKHVQRFFSYLSLFTFMMIILVTANNYLLMFVGWEGHLKCLIWLCLYINLIVYIYVNTWLKNKINGEILNYSSSVSSFHSFLSSGKFFPGGLSSGSENISLIIGSLLGNSYMRKSKSHPGIVITFIKCSDNIEYLMWFHKCLVCSGYCRPKKPRLNKIISKKNKIMYTYNIDSYNLPNFDWLYEMFYVFPNLPQRETGTSKIGPKVIPSNLEEFLTPLSLATWYLDNTDRLPKLHESSFIFTNKCPVFISDILKNKYNLEIITELKDNGKVFFYIKNCSIQEFSNIVKPYVLPSLQYKFKGQHNKLSLWSYNPTNSRSYSTNVKNIKSTMNYKKGYELSIIQKEALIGIILGDGFIERNKPSHNARLRIEQSYPEKEKYLNSLYELLEPLTLMKPTILTRNDKKRGITTKSLYFRTLAMPCLNYYHELFYPDKKKIIPRNLEEFLTARGLAIWIMDDGGKSVHNQTILHTRSYSKEEVLYLQFVLKRNFSLITRLEEKTKDQWVIYIPVRQTIRLKDIVAPYMHESMLYKI